MADKITWNDKVSLVTDPTIAEINKVTDDNMNEIKSVTNTNADELTEKIVYDESDITENTGLIIEEVPEGSNIPYINSEIAIGSTNEDNRPVWFKQGKNLFSSSLELGTFSNEGVKSASTTNYRNSTPIQVQPNTTYTFSINGVSQKYALYYYNNTNTFINSEGLTTGTFTTPTNCYYINFRCFNADFTSDYANLKLQIEEGSTATAYEEYITPSIIADDTEFYSKDNYEQYSLGETRIGTYLGKPLYRKIISVLVAANTTSNTALSSEGMNNPDIIIINTGKSVSHYNINVVGGAYNNPNYYSSTADYGNIYIDVNKVMHIVNNSSTQRQYYICLEYTKTTD